jgi:hypothetical protein
MQWVLEQSMIIFSNVPAEMDKMAEKTCDLGRNVEVI